MNDFEKRKAESIKSKHEKAMELMLKAQGMDYPACICFFALATVALAEAQVISASTERKHPLLIEDGEI